MAGNSHRAPFRLSPGRLFVHATLAFFVVFYAVPLIWLFLASFRDDASLVLESPYALGSLEDFGATWGNLVSYGDFQLGRWALNSLIYSVGGVSLSLVACIPAGYALALSDFPGRRLILTLTLVALITPTSAVALPIFLQMNLIGLANTYASVILATAFFPFGVYLAFIYFSTSLPRGVLDSARVDGCTRFQTFWKVALPMAKPAVALVAFFSFLANWSNYFLAFVLLSDDRLYNLPVGLAALVSGSGALSNRTANEIAIQKPEIILAACFVIVPVLVVFLGAQRLVRAGLLSGAEKG